MNDTIYQTKIEAMEEGGALAAQLREQLLESVYVGMETRELEESAKNFYESHDIEPSFLDYQGYPFTIIT